MLDFYKTNGGRRFIDATMPRIAKALETLAKEKGRLPFDEDVNELFSATEELLLISEIEEVCKAEGFETAFFRVSSIMEKIRGRL